MVMAKPIKFIAAGDLHGDEQDRKTVKALLAFAEDYQPDLVVMTGDLWDFRAIRKGAGDEDQASSLEEDWQAGEDFLRKFFSYGDERIFLRGNHDERIFDLSQNAKSGVARDYANDGIENIEALLKELRARMFPYDSVSGVYACGSLKFVHGYGHSMHAAKQHADAYGNVLFGHTHAIDYFKSVSIDSREAWNIGCLSNLAPSYNRNQMRRMRWQHGFAYGLIHLEDKSHDVFLAKQRGGKFVVPTTVRSF
jgi:predicted phosphodiesterase